MESRQVKIWKLMFVATVLLLSGCSTDPTLTPTIIPSSTPNLSTPTLISSPTSEPKDEEQNDESDPISVGKTLAARNGCAVCHSIDGSAAVGPSWLGLYNSQEELTNGSTVTVDEEYLYESIVNPNASITAGFTENIMPIDFAEKLSTEQIQAIIMYIQSLQ
jgi:mono/diheme cytochrome c family protein